MNTMSNEFGDIVSHIDHIKSLVDLAQQHSIKLFW